MFFDLVIPRRVAFDTNHLQTAVSMSQAGLPSSVVSVTPLHCSWKGTMLYAQQLLKISAYLVARGDRPCAS
jgi:hypothetical protein